jgi:hypothetical protein
VSTNTTIVGSISRFEAEPPPSVYASSDLHQNLSNNWLEHHRLAARRRRKAQSQQQVQLLGKGIPGGLLVPLAS